VITHIMNDAANPPEALVWTMLCGDQCIALDDGTLVPELDFYGDESPNADKADCDPCRRPAGLLPALVASESRGAGVTA
jgi:hypothetical protein